MANAKTLNAENLAALGAPRLASLLIDVSTGDATIKRRLRLELAGAAGGEAAAQAVSKRLTTLQKARGFLDAAQIRTLSVDLTAQHRAIVDVIAKTDAREALDLLWRFIALLKPLSTRADDRSDRLGAVFAVALADLPILAAAAKIDPDALSGQLIGVLRDNTFGEFDGLVLRLADVLGAEGLVALKTRLSAELAVTPVVESGKAHRGIGYGSEGWIHAEDIEARGRERALRSALKEVAEAQGDVDAYIAQFDERARRQPTLGADIARRLLGAGRAEDALAVLDAVETGRHAQSPYVCQEARAEVLAALGRTDQVRDLRWAWFLESLDPRHLRAHLKMLADFDDVEAEHRAIAHALSFSSARTALGFLTAWPDLEAASRLILARHEELNGDYFDELGPAADMLETRYPLAATLLRRAMIDFALDHTRPKRYPHAARHLAACAELAPRIADFAGHPSHDAYQAGLAATHARKPAFWACVRDLI